MNNQQDGQDQEEFVSWLAQQLGVKSHQELVTKLKQMGDDGIQKAYQQFKSQKKGETVDQDSNDDDTSSTQKMQRGGKLIKCLQAFKRGGKMEAEKCGCGSKMEKHQLGGPIKTTETPGDMSGYGTGYGQTTLLTTKENGTIGPWGNNLPSHPDTRSIILAPSQVGVPSIPLDHYAYLQQNVPNFDKMVGLPMGNAGDVKRFGTDQSDIIRALIKKYPMPAPNKSIVKSASTNSYTSNYKLGGKLEVLSNKKGGKMTKEADYCKDGSKMKKADTKEALPKGATNIQPSWAKKAVKGKEKPKSVDKKQPFHNGKGKQDPAI